MLFYTICVRRNLRATWLLVSFFSPVKTDLRYQFKVSAPNCQID